MQLERIVLLGVLSLSLLPACSPEESVSEAIGAKTQALSLVEQRMLGFEQPTDWVVVTGSATLGSSSLRREGAAALSVTGSGYSQIRQAFPLRKGNSAAPEVVGFDLWIPETSPDPWWRGSVELFIDAPSVGIWSQYLGIHSLQDLPVGTFTRLEFPVSEALRNKLEGNYSDLRFTIALNVPAGSAPHLLDRFTFGSGGPPVCSPVDDDNPCTVDDCDPVTNTPRHTPMAVGTSCSDGNACNGAELCDAAGSCQAGPPPVVDDENPCTIDVCEPETGVSHYPADLGTICGETDLCHAPSTCSIAGSCQPGALLPVDDGNVCTIDACDPVLGVTHTPAAAGTSCSDGNACNGVETCDGAGVCQAGTSLVVDDGNPCTIDSCDPILGATHSPAAEGTSCADADICNGVETCDGAGACRGGTPLVVDDDNPCTEDTCDPLLGAVFTNLPAGTSCWQDACFPLTCDGAGACSVSSEIPEGALCCDGALAFDPRLMAEIDPTVASGFAVAAAPLFEGENVSQQGFLPGVFDEDKLAVIEGRVLNAAGTPLGCAEISISNQAEYGFTKSRGDGSYALVVNGGGPVTVRVALNGYITSYRTLDTGWNRFAHAPEIRLLPLGEAHPVSSSATDVTVVAGEWEEDAHGRRQTALFVPPGTRAHVEGEAEPREEYAIRVKEVTNLAVSGREGMTASLPNQVAFTFAVSLDLAGAEDEDVVFDHPIPVYFENFLGFPNGENVPVGRFDPKSEQWIAEENGRVITITGVDLSGRALIDLDRTPGADNPSLLGMTDDELRTLAARYTPGTSLWRFVTDHFSLWDANFGWGPPPGAAPPSGPDPDDDGAPDPCLASGSIIECENQVLRESLVITGTQLRLSYSSARQRGSARSLRIPVTGASLPDGVRGVDLSIEVGGRAFRPNVGTEPNLLYKFDWDGKDAWGRPLSGAQPVRASIGFIYDGSYQQTSRFGYSGNGVPITASRERFEATLWKHWEGTIGTIDAEYAGLGGWTLDEHHLLDRRTNTIYLGSGAEQSVPGEYAELIVAAGTGSTGFSGDGGPAIQGVLNLAGPQVNSSLGVTADGSVYFSDSANDRIRRIAPNGIITTIAGGGSSYGEGGPATAALLNKPSALAVGPDGNVYIADSYHHRIRKIDLQTGMITTIVGTGVAGSSTNGPALQRQLNKPTGLTLARDGTIYIADSNNNRVQRVRDGVVDTMATGFSYPTGVAADSKGNVFVSDYGNNRVIKLGFDGRRTTYVGNGSTGVYPFGDGGLATAASLSQPDGVVVGPDDLVYIVDAAHHSIRRVNGDGTIQTVVGTGSAGYSNEVNVSTRSALVRPRGMGIGPDGAIYVVDTGNQRIRRTRPSVGHRVTSDGGRIIASRDGARQFVFDVQGRHLATRDAYTGAPLLEFGYDSEGRLLEVVDAHGRVTSIEREGSGRARAIIGQYAQRTQLTVDSGGVLRELVRPDGSRYSFEYDEGRLLTRLVDPKHQSSGGAGYVFQYERGKLVRDTDPRGGAQVLEKELYDAGWAVTRTDGAGRATTYETERNSGVSRRTVELPDGSMSVTESRLDGRAAYAAPNGRSYEERATAPDGTRVFSLKTQSPAFGASVPELSERLTVLPSGLRSLTQRSLSMSVDPIDGGVSSETETTNIAGQTYTSSYSRVAGARTSTTPEGRVTREFLDELSRVVELRVPGSPVVRTEYDGEHLTALLLDPDGVPGNGDERRTRMIYDPNTGHLTQVIDPLSQVTLFTGYDALDRPRVIQLPDTAQVQMSYDEEGNVASVTPPGKQPHAMSYGLEGRIESYTPPVGNAVQYHYDLGRRMDLIDFGPDAAGQPHRVDFVYDPVTGQLASILSPTGTIQVGYTNGHMTSLTSPSMNGPITTNIAYDGFLPTSVGWSGPVAGNVTWTYNDRFLIASETIGALPSTRVNYTYDRDGLVTQAGALNIARDPVSGRVLSKTIGSIRETYQYNEFGELARQTVVRIGSGGSVVETIYDVVYDDNGLNGDRDAMGRIVKKTERIVSEDAPTSGARPLNSRTYEYGYNQSGRPWLESVAVDGTVVSSYGYDANGNRTSAELAWSQLGYDTKFDASLTESDTSYDAADKLLQYGTKEYSWNNFGQLQSVYDSATDETTSCQYDLYGNLLSVVLPDGRTIEYDVDGAGRRVGRRVLDANGVELEFRGWIYRDLLRPIAEVDAAGNVVARYVYGNGQGARQNGLRQLSIRLGANPDTSLPFSGRNVPELIEIIGSGGVVSQRLSLLTSQVGTVQAVVDAATGEVVQRLEYDEFGRVLFDSNPGLQPFGFAGGIYDAETGFVRFGARDYESKTGRWIARDPVLFSSGTHGIYVYLDNDPKNFSDYNGLDSTSCYAYSFRMFNLCIDNCPWYAWWCPSQCSEGLNDNLRYCSDVRDEEDAEERERRRKKKEWDDYRRRINTSCMADEGECLACND